MAEATKIEWTDSTFNPWVGCSKVSTTCGGGGGCDHCYAEVSTPVRVLRGKGHETWGPGAPRQRTSAEYWKQPIRWNEQLFVECSVCGWRGEKRKANWTQCPTCSPTDGTLRPTRRRVFCASLADVFDNEVDPAWRADLFALIAETPNLDWLLLTKRIGLAHMMIGEALIALGTRSGGAGPTSLLPTWPWQHVWIGATVVNQREADRDVLKLLKTPAAVRFLSIEPMLGPIDLTKPRAFGLHGLGSFEHGIDWVIVGGESGPKARPMEREWARDLRNQCASAGVPFLFKQWGEYAPNWLMDDFNGTEQPDSMWMDRMGKKTAGRLLDGVEHNGFPKD